MAQELAIEALKDKEHIEKSVEFLNQQRKYLIRELTDIGLECTDSKTTNILVNVEKINPDAKQVVSRLKEQGVLVTNASYFRVPKNKYIRIAVSSKEENKIFIQTIKDILNSAK
jgi:threonine-phosphate decarboxylase